MSEIEKKYSDYQEAECEDSAAPLVLDDKICPTCVRDPSFKLEGEWFDIKKAYLDKSVCEYRVRVFESEALKELEEDGDGGEVRDKAIEVGILKILEEYGKPFDEGIKIQLTNAANIVDTYYNTGSQLLGMAFLIAVPAFNFDQLEDDPDIDKDKSKAAEGENQYPKSEFILPATQLFRKIHFLRLTVKTYGKYYSLVQKTSDSFVIRQKDDIVSRINYNKTEKQIKLFLRSLNDALDNAGYPHLDGVGLLKTKTLRRLKFTFKSGAHRYDLKNIYAMSENCPDKYEKLKISPSSPLRDLGNEVVYNFLQNLEKVYNDITSKETKPWLEWTLDHFYPEYIVDRGDVEGAEGDRSGLGCLLEEQLGLGGGKVVDSLASEIMSAFASIEADYNVQACREMDRLSESNDASRNSEDTAAVEERRHKMLARYKEEFKNKAVANGITILNDYFEMMNGVRQEIVTRSNFFKHAADKQQGHYNYWNRVGTVTYKFKNPKTKKREMKMFSHNIETPDDLERGAVAYAYQKFIDLDQGNFRDKVGNSPHYHEAVESLKETYETKNNFIDDLKDSFSGKSDFEPLDLINVIGICGLSKTAGKALECIAGGVSFDVFLDILIEKSFEFMKLNTLDLFFNSLPYGFRRELQEAIDEQFGPTVNLTNLFGIKLTDGGDEKLKDFIKSKQVGRRIKEMFETYKEPWIEANDEDKEYISANLGDDIEVYEDIQRAIAGVGFNRESKTYPDSKVTRVKFTVKGQEASQTKEFSRDKWVLKYIKFVIRGYKIRGSDFIAASRRIASSMGEAIDEKIQDVKEGVQTRQTLRDNIKDLEELINLEEASFGDLIRGQKIVFSGSGLLENLPANKSAFLAEGKNILDRIKDYESVQNTLREQLKKEKVSTQTRDKIEESYQNLADFLEVAWDDAVEEVKDSWEGTTESAAALGASLATGLYSYKSDFFGTLRQSARNIKSDIEEINGKVSDAINDVGEKLESVAPDLVYTEDELNKFELAQNSFQETALGVKVDIIFDLVFDYLVDAIMEEFALDDLFERFKAYRGSEFALGLLESFNVSCPNTPIFHPPPGDFMKSLSVDICDPSISLTLPTISIPSIDWRWHIQSQFTEIFREAILKLVSEIIINLASKLLGALEGSLCNLAEAIARGAVTKDSFLEALNEAFCNDGENAESARSRAEELADALFSPLMFDAGIDPVGGGKKVSGIISAVASTDDILGGMVAREGEEDEKFNQRVATAVNILAPEMRALLGSPSQVAYFFSNLGSHLSPDDRERIRNLLDAGIPNMPVSSAICLTNEQLKDWNDMRDKLLQDQGLTPEQAADIVDDLNDKSKKALEDLMDALGELDDDGGMEDGLKNAGDGGNGGDGKGACGLNNDLNPTREDPVTKAAQEQLIENFYDNIGRSIARGMTGRNSILGEALRDFDGRREIGRKFLQLFTKNVQNSQEERDAVYAERGWLGQKIMDIPTEGEVISQYPKTVGITQREKILEDKHYDFSKNGKNIIYRFHDSSEDSELSFTQDVISTNNRGAKGNFNYEFRLQEKLNEQPYVSELEFMVSVPIGDAKENFMESIGFQYKTDTTSDIRKGLFNKICQKQIPLNFKNYDSTYESAFEDLNKLMVELMLTDPRQSDGIPMGYRFGYVTEDLTEDSFEYFNPDGSTPYNLDESEKTLGKFGSSRIIPLDPGSYGGRYSNPPYYVEPRQFTGWMELATKAFSSPSGCNPKKPPLLTFNDIKDRQKDLQDLLREDPRLGRSPECVTEKPFHLLLDKKTKAKLDGVIRTTIRTYVTEYFFKGYGLFSNLELSPSNFDQGLFLYIINKMKTEMIDLGWSFSNRRITITREKYWYTFLEQCVEAYQRMIDVDGEVPSENVANALNSIQRGLDAFRPIDTSVRKKMRKHLKNNGDLVRKPEKNYIPIDVVKQGPVKMGLQAVAFRLTTDEQEKKDFFNGKDYDDLTPKDIRFASIKKLRFFQKIYFIALYEKEAQIIMSELIRQELGRLGDSMIDGLTDKPTIKYLDRFLLSTFPGSSTRVGLSKYYLEKQANGQSDPGQVPEVQSDTATPPQPASDKAQFIIESYAKITNRQDPNLPSFIKNRPQKYVGTIPLSKLSEFVSENLDFLEENYISDYFGDLSFLYKGQIGNLTNWGTNGLARLIELNPDKEDIIRKAADQAMMGFSVNGENYLLEEVVYDESFGHAEWVTEPPKEFGTIGSTGIKYGLRLSIILPQGTLTDSEISALKQNVDFMNKSRNEKSYLFDDNTLVLPLVSEEVNVMDARFIHLDPFSGTERYDLECLINKLVEKPEFKLLMENVFNVKQCSSMLSIYCMETMLPAFGRKVAPDESNDSENFERSNGKETDPDDDWDGTINKFGKNFLRREFKSAYLCRSVDGLNTSNDTDDDGLPGIAGLFSTGNPFDRLTMPTVRLPWWMKRRMKKKVYDANGVNCADPKKDLQ